MADEVKITGPRRSLGDDAWIEFKTSGYSFGLQRKLREERNDQKVLELIRPFIIACRLPMVDGQWLDGIVSVEDFDAIDEMVIVQVIKEFYAYRAERMYSIPPNS